MNVLELRRRTLGKGVYKKAVEGNPAIAQGSLARMYPKIEMQGWTEQAQYKGFQLFDGVFTVDTMLDTNGETAPYSGRNTTDFIKVKQSTDYTGFTRYLRACYYDAGKVIISYDDDDTVTRQTPEGCEYVRFCFIKGSNVMFNEGSTALPYEPYTGGKPSPNPDYPQEIVSAGKYNEDTQKWEYEVKLTGKNLLPYGEGNIKIGIPYEIRGRTYILNKDGSITITTQGSSESSTGNIFIFGAVGDRKHYKLPAGKYTVSTFNGNIPNMSIQLEDENGVNTRSVSVGKFELKEHERIAYAWLYGAAGTEWNGTIYPQLEYGGVSTSYEQYKLPQTVTLTSDRPLTKWDKLEKRNGQWGWGYKSAEIESYTDESVPGEYYSTTGQLSVGAQVWYETATKTFVPLSPEEQKQMNALHTFRPTTVLSNDCGCNMELTYKTKKSLEVTD